jgi:hypothetical protein
MKAKQVWITLQKPGESDFKEIDIMMTSKGFEPIDEDEGWTENKGLWTCCFAEEDPERGAE